MNRQSSRQDSAAQENARTGNAAASRCVRLGLVATLGTSLALFLPDMPHAQQRYKEPPVKVVGVRCGGGTVSIVGDDSLSRAQTWQDAEGFHVVLVNGQAAPAGMSCGVRVRRVGNSLELVVPVKQGASVTVEPRGNRLDLVVSGGHGGTLNVENFPVERYVEAASNVQTPGPREQTPRQGEESRAQRPAVVRRAEPATAAAEQTQPSSQPHERQPAEQATSEPAPTISVPTNTSSQAPEPAYAPQWNPSGAQTEPAELKAGAAGGGPFNIFWLSSLLALLALAGAAFFVVRRRRASAGDEVIEVEGVKNGDERHAEEESQKPFQQFGGDRRKSSIAVPFERRVAGRGAEDEASRQLLALGANGASRNGEQSERGVESKMASLAVQFGAYRIDQEVARLVEGESHSVEVLNSRASDDRRAVETSLLKALHAPETDEDGRQRVRTALEDYGFVARTCAALLLGPESFARASSARTLGEMKSARALPFLTEALYDPDPVVRMECVQSLGAMGLPSAIGALLDVARRHPDIPAGVIGPALTACSVESLELTWDSAFASRTFADAGEAEEFDGDVAMRGPAEEFEALPEWIEDETLQGALERLQNADVESRVHSAQQLAQFQVRRAVEALTAMARHDSESAVRSAAVTSLGLINHESVFAPVIVALADDAREVRAAAARALSRLSFDRADAYVRVLESADGEALAEVAEACVKAGLAAQAINRLASEDRRQAYEAFSLLSLCAKAGQTQPILDTVECHRDIEVRLACIRLLRLINQSELGERLLLIAGNGGVPERVRRAILETVERAQQPQAVPVEVAVE